MKPETAAAKAYLSQIPKEKGRQIAFEKRLKELEQSQTYISAISYDSPAVQHTSSGESPQIMASIKLMDLSKETKQKIANAETHRQILINELYDLKDPDFINVLKARFLDGLTIEEIAERFYWSFDYAKHRMSDALSAFYHQYEAQIIDFMKSA